MEKQEKIKWFDVLINISALFLALFIFVFSMSFSHRILVYSVMLFSIFFAIFSISISNLTSFIPLRLIIIHPIKQFNSYKTILIVSFAVPVSLFVFSFVLSTIPSIPNDFFISTIDFLKKKWFEIISLILILNAISKIKQ